MRACPHVPPPPHTHSCIYHCICHCQNWLRGPIQGVSKQEVTRLVVPLAAGTPVLAYLHICMAPSVHWGTHGPLSTHLWACKTHEMREVEYDLE